jgi:hypothetical protein
LSFEAGHTDPAIVFGLNRVQKGHAWNPQTREADPMRLICPNCQQTVTIADSEAGKTIACPQCAHSFAAPQMYVPPPVEPLPGPALAPPPAAPATAEAIPAAAPDAATMPPAHALATPEGYTRLHTHALNHKVCEWIVPISFTLVFFLSFFKWFGFYPAGYSAYTQNAWQALFATMSVDPVSEKLFHKEKELEAALHPSWWLLPYLFLMLFGLALAWADHVVKALKLRLPAAVERRWRYRPALLSACAGLTLFFLLIQCATGPGLERARPAIVEESTRKELEKARTPEEIQIAEMKIANETGGFRLITTFWLQLAIVCHFLAVAGIIGETVLIHRGDKPPPRVGVMW